MLVWLIIALVGGIALMGALAIGVIERTKEIGVLRALGARSRTVMSLFVMEGNLHGLLSWAIAVTGLADRHHSDRDDSFAAPRTQRQPHQRP